MLAVVPVGVSTMSRNRVKLSLSTGHHVVIHQYNNPKYQVYRVGSEAEKIHLGEFEEIGDVFDFVRSDTPGRILQ